LQGATLIEPDMQISRIRLSDKTSRLRFAEPEHRRCTRNAWLQGIGFRIFDVKWSNL